MIKFGRSFWWMLFLTGISFFLSQLPWLSPNPIFIRLAIALLVILVASAAWTALSLHGISLNRFTRVTRKQVGEVFTEEYEIFNRSILPKIWLKITDLSDLISGTGSKVITGVGGRQSRMYVGLALLQKRGWFTLSPTQVESGDIFGLFLQTKRFNSSLRLLVIPYMVDIQFFLVPYGILPGGRALREKTLDVTPYAAGVREYVPGDPLRRIHWPSSTRKQKLIVKEFEKDPLAEVWIFLDARASVHIRSDESGLGDLHRIWWVRYKKAFRLPPDTAEYAISIAASIAKYYINQKREVGLVSAGQHFMVLPAERGERQLGKILETLAVLEPEGDLPIWGLVNTQTRHLAKGSTVVLITPEADEQILRVTMEIIHRGLIPVLILLDPSSFGDKPGSTELAEQLSAQGVITFTVRAGDDLKTILEKPQPQFNPRVYF
ncbi:MAG: DUF58 domain-containing protein [Brevefilum sp.]